MRATFAKLSKAFVRRDPQRRPAAFAVSSIWRQSKLIQERKKSDDFRAANCDAQRLKKPGERPGFLMRRISGERKDYAASSISASSASASTSSALTPRRGPFWSCASIVFSDSVSVSFCTTTTSRAMRSSAAS